MSETISKIKELKTSIDKKDLKDYGKSFQIKVLKLIIKDKSYAFTVLPILKSEYFSDPYIRGLYEIIKKYINEYNRSPSIDNIKVLLVDEIEKPRPYEILLNEIEKIDLDDRDFIIKNLGNFCFKKHAEAKLEEALRKISLGKFEEAQSIAYETFKYTTNNTTRIYSSKEDMDMVFNEDKVINPLPTIFPTYNDLMQGGPGAGKLVIAVGPSNFGKSNFLVATARRLNEEGKTVVLFSFEIGGSEMFRRHYAGLVNEKQADVKFSRTKVENKINNDSFGEFIIVEEKATKARMSTIVHNLNFLKSQGVFPDVILIDGLNQLKLPEGMRYEGDNRMFEYLAEEMRDLAKEEQIPIYTVFQGNRTSFRSEINDEQNIGKAIEPLQVADALIFFSQTPEMAKRGICYVNLLKNRMGKKGIVLECEYDPDKCVFIEKGIFNPELNITTEQIAKSASTGRAFIERYNIKK